MSHHGNEANYISHNSERATTSDRPWCCGKVQTTIPTRLCALSLGKNPEYPFVVSRIMKPRLQLPEGCTFSCGRKMTLSGHRRACAPVAQAPALLHEVLAGAGRCGGQKINSEAVVKIKIFI